MFASEDLPREALAVDVNTFRSLIPTCFQQCSYSNVHIEDTTRTASASRTIQEQGHFPTTLSIQCILRWDATGGNSTAVNWVVHNVASGQRKRLPRLEQELGESIRRTVGRHLAPHPRGIPKPALLLNDPIVAPGNIFEEAYTGTLRDYSACAVASQVSDLTSGVLPLGRYAFEINGQVQQGPELFVGKSQSGSPMEYNGVLVCAPQNSGKTSLIVRWAEAAARSGKPYAIFVIDVKGNLRRKLEDRLAGEIYCFSTDPTVYSDRINFLDGPMGLDAVESDRLQQLATALIPSRGFVESGGIDEYHYRNRVIWLTAFMHILKLCQCYYPEHFQDDAGKERNVDLADLYDLIASEEIFYQCVEQLVTAEEEASKRIEIPPCGVDHWLSELAIMLDQNRISAGQRSDRDSFRTYTTALLTALEPFSRHGTLHRKIRSFGQGRSFDIEGTLGGEQRPVTIILEARQQDLEKSNAVLSLAIKRLQWFLFDRMGQADSGEQPILLLLDETRRIRDFDAAEYVTFAREAKVACVVVYQSLEQIPAAKRSELLENVGIQIYLGSLVGGTARSFISILPQRSRSLVTRQVTSSPNTETVTTTTAQQMVDYFGTAELHSLPAGNWPALIYMNDQPRRPPFFTDMTDPNAPS